MKKGWALLRKGLNIEKEARVDEQRVTFLGCRIKRTTIGLKGRWLATAITYDMEKFFEVMRR